MPTIQTTPVIQIKDEGSSQGFVSVIDCVGAGVAAAVSGTTGTFTIDGGSGGLPDDTDTAAKGSSDTTGYVLNITKARGTVGSPNAITSGDDIFQFTFKAYVGATNQYVEAVRILADSAGTVSDASNGVGGVLRVYTRTSGGSLTEAINVDDSQNIGVGKTATTKFDVNGGGNFDGVLSVKAGGASDTAKCGGVLSVQTTATGNVGTGEDDLLTYSVPASTLGTNGDSIWFEASGSFANNGNNKALRVRFGSSGTTLIFDTTALAFDATQWRVIGRIVRTGAATQKASASWSSSNSLLLASAGNVTGLDQTLSGAVSVRITGEATANNDIVCDSLVVGWEPNNT